MIIVNIPAGVTKVTTTPLYEWDYGQVLRITGDGLPSVCQVHFCDKTCDKTIVRIGSPVSGGIEVPIPDKLLENEWSINAFIYICGDDCGQTIKHIQIPVVKRKQPEDFIDPIPPTAQTQLEEMIAAVNETLEDIEALYDSTITYAELQELIEEEMEEPIATVNAAAGIVQTYNDRLTTNEEKTTTHDSEIPYVTKPNVDQYAGKELLNVDDESLNGNATGEILSISVPNFGSSEKVLFLVTVLVRVAGNKFGVEDFPIANVQPTIPCWVDNADTASACSPQYFLTVGAEEDSVFGERKDIPWYFKYSYEKAQNRLNIYWSCLTIAKDKTVIPTGYKMKCHFIGLKIITFKSKTSGGE